MVRFVGQVSDRERLGELYRSAACLLFPSFYEASPLPPIEAMSFGCPVVASAIASMTERCGRAALYCDPYDVDDMVAAVRRARDGGQIVTAAVAAGYEKAEQLSWEVQARAVLAAIAGAG